MRGKSFIIVIHEYNSKGKYKTITRTIEPNKKGNITLQMLSDALDTVFNHQGEEGLQEFKTNAEDEHSIVSFLYFDH